MRHEITIEGLTHAGQGALLQFCADNLKDGIQPQVYADHLLSSADWKQGARFSIPAGLSKDGHEKTLILCHLDEIKTPDVFRVNNDEITHLTPINMANYENAEAAIQALEDGTACTHRSLAQGCTGMLDAINDMKGAASVLGMADDLGVFFKWRGRWYSCEEADIY